MVIVRAGASASTGLRAYWDCSDTRVPFKGKPEHKQPTKNYVYTDVLFLIYVT